MKRWRSSRLGICLFALAVLSGCSLHGLEFKEDHLVRIVNPMASHQVKLPLDVQWVTQGADNLHFGVFVDAFPMRPGQSIKDLNLCAGHLRSRCDNPAYLERAGVFTTSDHELVLDSLPDLSAQSADKNEVHDLAIVLLDRQGRRVGEHSYHIEFYYRRATS